MIFGSFFSHWISHFAVMISVYGVSVERKQIFQNFKKKMLQIIMNSIDLLWVLIYNEVCLILRTLLLKKIICMHKNLTC